ncbi:unnamed protein product, partial [Polarella glacialis]
MAGYPSIPPNSPSSEMLQAVSSTHSVGFGDEAPPWDDGTNLSVPSGGRRRLPTRPSTAPPSRGPARGRPATAQQAEDPLQVNAAPRPCQGTERLWRELEDLQAKVATLLREKKKQQELLQQKDERLKTLAEELVDKGKKDPSGKHPAIQRLRKLGLNTQALADLDDRWAGYVLGRVSMGMEVGSFVFHTVFTSHAQQGYLTEASFKAVIRQFEPDIKSDQLTRLWFFADNDGSGRIDIFEFMRMFGCNANGDMSDSYYEVVALHIYRRFHGKGGVRRMHHMADKNWDQQLSLDEFTVFMRQNFKDLQLKTREYDEVFSRMNTAGDGNLSLQELEAALDLVGAKSFVSEAWVRETFQEVAVAVQDAGVPLCQLFPGPLVNAKDFKDAIHRFLPVVKHSQLDRLWKFLMVRFPYDLVARPGGGGDDSKCFSSDIVITAVFGPTLAGTQGEQSEFALAEGALNQSPGPGFTPPEGAGREVLEQLFHELVNRVGEVCPSKCWDKMEPFLTSAHFQELLTNRLGLEYSTLKAKQIFSLMDTDRDGKITRS